MTDQVLVIEDDPDIALGIKTVLDRSGFEVAEANTGREGLRAFHAHQPDLVVLDIGLPEMDGWTVLERIRDLSDVPVLILTGHGLEAEKVRGLRGGADDYLTKPFGNAEFVARVQALLRRRQAAEPTPAEVYDDGSVRVNFGTHEVVVDGVPVELTATEYRLLAALIRHRGQVLSPVKLLELAWSDPFGVGPERVKYSVMRLRRKLSTNGDAGPSIEAVRGFGYRYRTGSRPDKPGKLATVPHHRSHQVDILTRQTLGSWMHHQRTSTAGKPASRGRVLLVEDDPEFALFCTHVLARGGRFDVTHIADPTAALALAAAQRLGSRHHRPRPAAYVGV